jgi:hypothetical protein
MNSHIFMCAWARHLKKVTMLFLVVVFWVILTVLVHFSLSTGMTDATIATQYHPNEVGDPDPASGESIGNTTSTETYSNIPERDNQIIREQPENASCPSAVDSTESLGQVSNVPNNENVPLPTPLPDGRIFARGEPPYGYLPTCSPKDKDMPFVPVEPN